MPSMKLPRELAERRTILRTLVGSTVHGLNVRDAVEDRDERGVLVEPFEAVVGFSRFEQFIYRSAAEREGRQDARSQAGDLDLVIYSLRKYLRLCLTGNPTMMLPLYAPADATILCTRWAQNCGRWPLASPAAAPDTPSWATCSHRSSACSAPAARCGCAVRNWWRGTATTRNTRCTYAALATRVWSSCRQAA
jgi:RNA repair pathway DNA polymerase beta family